MNSKSLKYLCLDKVSLMLINSAICETYKRLEVKCDFCERQYEKIFKFFEGQRITKDVLRDLEDFFFTNYPFNKDNIDSLKTFTCFRIFLQKGQKILKSI